MQKPKPPSLFRSLFLVLKSALLECVNYHVLAFRIVVYLFKPVQYFTESHCHLQEEQTSFGWPTKMRVLDSDQNTNARDMVRK